MYVGLYSNNIAVVIGSNATGILPELGVMCSNIIGLLIAGIYTATFLLLSMQVPLAGVGVNETAFETTAFAPLAVPEFEVTMVLADALVTMFG
jgi:hypothetical protein